MKRHDLQPMVAKLDNVTRTFSNNSHLTYAVRDISLKAAPGEFILLLGPSGSGKTTLLTLIAGLLRPTSGSVMIFERNVSEYGHKELQKMRAEEIGFVFQNFLLIDALTALQNVVLVQTFKGCARREAVNRGTEIFRELSISYLADKLPRQMSQGEKQRVAIARAIANNPRLILADEPTANLETKQGWEIIRLLHNLAKSQNRCVITASHDLRLKDVADQVLNLEDGRIVKNRYE
jgi:putative ABC transport system ATP-binding protein